MAEKTLLHVCESVWLRGHPSTASEGAVPSGANTLVGQGIRSSKWRIARGVWGL